MSSVVKTIGTLLGAAVAVIVSIPRAQADEESGVVTTGGGWERCPDGYYCLYDGFDGTGPMAYFKTGSPNLAKHGLDKATSSQWNRSPWPFVLYEGYGYTGRHNGDDPPGSRWNFSEVGGNNSFSSVRRA